MYKNAGFFKRFFSNLIDFVLFIAIAIAIIFIGKPNDITTNSKYYYLSMILIMIWLNCYYILFPFLIGGKTPGMWIFNLKLLSNVDKKFHYTLILKRNILGCLFVTLNFIIVLIATASIDLNQFKDIKQANENVNIQIITAIITALMGTWFLLQTLGYVLLIFYKKRLTIIDIAFSSRVVEDKYLEIIASKDIILIPYYYTERTFKYYNEINETQGD
ncbi:RDD family protein [Mycoplasma sp. 005V]|uniref:RDD family protein n=1 Tax=unclassified Mycoplasma TaxID=2683645 RepID=UPI003A84C484